MKMNRLILAYLALGLVPMAAAFGDPPIDPPVTISLRLTVERGEQRIEILVKNVSPKAIEITSEDDAPPWSVQLWFKWQVDGTNAEYSEHIAMIPGGLDHNFANCCHC
ncbi:MAG: hypothetical protein WCJ35_26855 [Planctomycetota bacterium]